MKALVVVPTYNERGNLEPLAEAILALPEGFSILVVDDSSPDGTGELADELAKRYPGRLSVLHRTSKDGLGRAYAAGFTQALASDAEFIFQMDADFSHDPAALPALLAPLVAGTADLVLGSRYVPGGGCPGWSLSRRLISRWGSFYARNLLRLRQRDLTGGFKGWRRNLLAAVNPGAAAARGYTFQIELTLRALKAGGRVQEVAILFRERQVGDSKMSLKIALEAAWRVPALAWNPPEVPPMAERR